MEERIQYLVDCYLSGELSIDDFSQRFAGLYFEVRGDRNSLSGAARLCNMIIGLFAEYSRGDRTEESLRQHLTGIAGVFQLPSHLELEQPHGLR